MGRKTYSRYHPTLLFYKRMQNNTLNLITVSRAALPARRLESWSFGNGSHHPPLLCVPTYGDP